MGPTARAAHCRSRRRFLQGSLALVGLGLLSGCGMLPPQPRQPARRARLGYISPGTGPGPAFAAFMRQLGEHGWTEGHNLDLEQRWGREGEMPVLAADLVRIGVDVIFRAGVGVDAAKRATDTIPIVMAYSGDPIRAGLVASLARPGGNVTGLTAGSPLVAGKQLELLREPLPCLGRVAVLADPTSPISAVDWQELQAPAGALGLRLLRLDVQGAEDFEGAFVAAAAERAEALLTIREVLFLDFRSQLAELALQHYLPTMQSYKDQVQAGGLMAYGADRVDVVRRAATYVDKILKGAKPADLPVEQPTKFDFVINLKTAQALGLQIPPFILAQATEVIQ